MYHRGVDGWVGLRSCPGYREIRCPSHDYRENSGQVSQNKSAGEILPYANTYLLLERLDEVKKQILAQHPKAQLRTLILDLASFANVRKAAAEFNAFPERTHVSSLSMFHVRRYLTSFSEGSHQQRWEFPRHLREDRRRRRTTAPSQRSWPLLVHCLDLPSYRGRCNSREPS